MTFPTTMHAIVHERGAPLRLVETQTPIPKAGDVLIKVAAAGVNRPDLLQRDGLYPPPPGASETLGLEVAGEIVVVGDGVVRWKPGDQVCALLAGGGYATYAVAPEGAALPIPAGLSHAEAAALPETSFTVWSNLFEIGRLAAGETALIHGGASGIGTTAIQLAAARGAKVFATVRDAEKAEACAKLGADVIVARDADFAATLKERGGADVILDIVGADYFAKNIDALKDGGRLVVIGVMSGAQVELNLFAMIRRRLTVAGSAMRSRGPDEKARLAREVEANVWPLIAAGKYRPILDQTFPLADAESAHARMRESGHTGKIVLTIA